MSDVADRGEYCTRFVEGECDEWCPCRCPECGGYLPGDFIVDEGVQFQCHSCGAVLEIIYDPPDPELVEIWKEEHSGILYEMGFLPVPEYKASFSPGGRICVVPNYAVKIERVDYKALRKDRPPRKHATEMWALGLGFSRRVWRDKNGEFITINGERLNIGDNRISVITTSSEILQISEKQGENNDK